MVERPYNVLIVDDEPGICDLIHTMIYAQFPGILIPVSTTSPEEALRLIDKGNLHIVVTDFLMPNKLGVDVITRTKEKNNWVQTIVITGANEMVTALTCFHDGANIFIKKPFGSREFQQRLNNAVERLDFWQEIFQSYKHIQL